MTEERLASGGRSLRTTTPFEMVCMESDEYGHWVRTWNEPLPAGTDPRETDTARALGMPPTGERDAPL